MKLAIGDRVKVKDPADRRKHTSGTVQATNEGRGSLYYLILLDDDPTPMAFDETEIINKV